MKLSIQKPPWPLRYDAMKRVFPPGAAQQSMMVSPGCGLTTDTTKPAAKSQSTKQIMLSKVLPPTMMTNKLAMSTYPHNIYR